MTARGSEFFDNVAKIIERARAYAGRTADLTMRVAYFEARRRIVEEEQGGKGFSESALRNARKFYQVYAPAIQQTLFAESEKNQIAFSQAYPFALSGSYYLIPMRIENPDEIYASKYSLYLPDKTLLQQKLAEWTQEFEETLEAQKAAAIARQPVAQLENSSTGENSDEV